MVDASVLVAWLLPDESSEAADQVLALANTETLSAPALILLEVANAIVMAQRRQRITALEAQACLADLGRAPILLAPAIDRAGMARTAELAQLRGLSVYDAVYIDLAVQSGAELATFDGRLAAAARAEGVSVLPAIA